MNLQFSTSFTSHIVNGLDRLLPLVPNALFDLLVGIIVIRLIVRIGRLLMKIANVQPGLRDVVSSIVETILWMLLSVTLLTELGFAGIIYFFTGSIAAIGLAMAAGGSTLVSDIVAGIFLARDVDFNVGDDIEVLLPTGILTRGHIESMDSRRTRLRDSNGLLHILPNSVIERNEWIVHQKRPGIGTRQSDESRQAYPSRRPPKTRRCRRKTPSQLVGLHKNRLGCANYYNCGTLEEITKAHKQ